MYIYSGASLADCSAPAPPSPRYPTIHAEAGVRVLRGDRRTVGIRVRLSSVPSMAEVCGSPLGAGAGGDRDDLPPPLDPSSGGGDAATVTRDVLFGDSPEDVVSAIGAPARIFFKAEDKMKIHSPNARRKAAAQKSDYFYNYFTLGFVSHPLAPLQFERNGFN